ncbi:MAG: class I SAM-dependent methyltransferase [Micrococcales bacterium]|nr:class I SAM-dependent methyltransferase [Micrococcales bacterium]
MNTEMFTGKADAYARGRPGYPAPSVDYISTLVRKGAVFADVGAGTGIFTALIAERGYEVFGVEPNTDMLEQLTATLSPYPHATAVPGTAEATTLPDHSVDVITCAQALHWFDPDVFRTECRRIGVPGALVIAIYNVTPGGTSATHSRSSTEKFFTRPMFREFPNPIFHTRQTWVQYMTSHSENPLPSDPTYDAHLADVNARFDRENVDGLLRQDITTRVYSERLT